MLLDIEIDYDFARPATSDAIADAVDYGAIAAGVTEMIQKKRFQLLETMAEQTAVMLLNRIPEVTTVRLEIRKPAAVPAAACSFVRIVRTRP